MYTSNPFYDIMMSQQAEEKKSKSLTPGEDFMGPAELYEAPPPLPPQDNSDEAMKARIRSNLMERLQGYDSEANSAEMQSQLANAGSSTGQQVASVIGSMLTAGGGKAQYADLDKKDARARKEITDRFKEKDAAYQKDLGAMKDFDTMDRMDSAESRRQAIFDRAEKEYGNKYTYPDPNTGEQVTTNLTEMKAAKSIADMKASTFANQMNKKIFADKEAAFDPNSEQSKFARKTIFDATGDKVSDKMPASQLTGALKAAYAKMAAKAKAAAAAKKIGSKKDDILAKEARSEERAIAREARSEDRAMAKETRALDRFKVKEDRKETRNLAKEKRKRGAKGIELKTRYGNINNNLSSLKNLVAEYGTDEWTGPQGAQMEQHLENIAVDFAKLMDPESVARESEVESAKRMLFKPGIFQTEATVQSQLDNFRKIMDERIKTDETVRNAVFGGGAGNSEAEEWLSNNPDDPRAEAVRKKLGL